MHFLISPLAYPPYYRSFPVTDKCPLCSRTQINLNDMIQFLNKTELGSTGLPGRPDLF